MNNNYCYDYSNGNNYYNNTRSSNLGIPDNLFEAVCPIIEDIGKITILFLKCIYTS